MKFFLIIISMFLFLNLHAAEKLSVTFFSPNLKTTKNTFWHNVESFLKSVAKDLKVDLKVVYSSDNRFSYQQSIISEMNSSNPPSYIIFLFQKGIGQKILSVAEKKGIKSFTFNTQVFVDENELIKMPRERYQNWIGSMYPDDIEGGRLLSHYLLSEAKRAEKIPSVLAFTGGRESTVSSHRNLGLKEGLLKYQDARLNQILYTDWSPEKAYRQATVAMDRYNDTNIIWSASDHINLKVIESLKQSKNRVIHKIYSGGFDWALPALESIEAGESSASVGGHFIEAGLVLLLIYDYHHGVDFKDSIGIDIKSHLNLINKDNVKNYMKILKHKSWEKIDFTKQSKVFNKKLKKYNLSFSGLLGH